MGNEYVFDEDASTFVEIPKMVTSECSSEVGDDAVRETESVDDIFEELNCFFAVAEMSSLYSIHLEKLSMAMYTYRKSPSAGLKGPIISSP